MKEDDNKICVHCCFDRDNSPVGKSFFSMFMNIKQKKILNILLISAIFLIFFIAFSGCSMSELTQPITGGTAGPAGLSKGDVANTIKKLSEFMVAGASTVALIYIIIGGVQYMMAIGNSQKTSQAVATLTWATFGFILIIASYIIVTYVIGKIG